jgi:hypothetical protein
MDSEQRDAKPHALTNRSVSWKPRGLLAKNAHQRQCPQSQRNMNQRRVSRGRGITTPTATGRICSNAPSMTCAMKPRVNRWVRARWRAASDWRKCPDPCHSINSRRQHQKPGRGQEKSQRYAEGRRLFKRETGGNHGVEIRISNPPSACDGFVKVAVAAQKVVERIRLAMDQKRMRCPGCKPSSAANTNSIGSGGSKPRPSTTRSGGALMWADGPTRLAWPNHRVHCSLPKTGHTSGTESAPP